MTERKQSFYLEIGQPVKIFPVDFPPPVANLKDGRNYSDYPTLSIKKCTLLKKKCPEGFEWGYCRHTPDMVISYVYYAPTYQRVRAYYP
jgi:hypothetical protein